METLSKLFGSETKLKMIRLFLFNPEHIFSTADISKRTKSHVSKVRREIGQLEKMGLVKKRVVRKGRVINGYVLDSQFIYLAPLHHFLMNIEPLQPKEVVKKLSRLGSLKMVLMAGVFIQDPESRVDLLVVGDGIKGNSLDNTIKNLEAEIGKELKYAHFSTEDFKYRLSMYDKLTRDILDYPHKKVVNKLGIV